MDGDITIVAAVALISWPFITLALFAILGVVRGFIWALIVGYLFLPERVGFDLPLLPPYSKYEALSYSLLLALLAGRQHIKLPELKLAAPGIRTVLLAMAGVLLAMPIMTFITNRSTEVMNGAVLPGLGIADYLVMFTGILVPLVPFFLARRWLAIPEYQTKFLIALVFLTFGYAFLALFEVRMSPQLNNWFYGYFPHLWLQHLRGDGYRPLVFLNHGLSLGLLLFMATVAVTALLGQARAAQDKALLVIAGTVIFGTLLLSKNLGAVMLALIFVPLLVVFRTRMQAFAVAAVALMFMFYPVVRHYAPVEAVTATLGTVAPERAHSLQYRLDNETILLDRANERPMFGWGIWGRPMIYDDRGARSSVTDGTWILILGTYGWVGFIAFFGVMVVPLVALGRTARRKPIPIQTMALAMMGAGNLIYLIPNSTLTPLSWLIFGALAGFVERDLKQEADDKDTVAEPEVRRTRYTRFGTDTVAPHRLARNVTMTTRRGR